MCRNRLANLKQLQAHLDLRVQRLPRTGLEELLRHENALRQLTDALSMTPVFEAVQATTKNEGGLRFGSLDDSSKTTFLTDITVDAWRPTGDPDDQHSGRPALYDTALLDAELHPLDAPDYDQFLQKQRKKDLDRAEGILKEWCEQLPYLIGIDEAANAVSSGSGSVAQSAKPKRRGGQITSNPKKDRQLHDACKAHGGNRKATAKALGVPLNELKAALDRHRKR